MPFAPSDLTLHSPAFEDGGAIPARYTGEAENVSPPFSWTKVPEGTQAFALVCHDPDAPLVTPDGHYGYVHWVLYGIPGDVTDLPEGTGDYVQGVNQTGAPGYTGPMPPPGHGLHRYFFWLLALKEAPELPPGLDLYGLLAKIEPHVIGMNRRLGTYQRG